MNLTQILRAIGVDEDVIELISAQANIPEEVVVQTAVREVYNVQQVTIAPRPMTGDPCIVLEL